MKCVDCDYELEGLDKDGKCPECGLPIRRSAAVLRLKEKSTGWKWDLGLLGCGLVYAIANVLLIALLGANMPEALFAADTWFVFGSPVVAIVVMALLNGAKRRSWSYVAMMVFIAGMLLLGALSRQFINWWGMLWAI